MSLLNPGLLCPSIVTETDVPHVHSNGEVTAHKIRVSACSEYKKHSVPAVHFDATHRLHFVLDGTHQPLIFTLGKDQRFYCIHHASGLSWNTHELRVGDSETNVSNFHVVQHSNSHVAVVAAAQTTEGSDLYYAKPFDVSSGSFDPSTISFIKVHNNIGPINIATLSVAAADVTMSKCFITVGTAETETKLATDYVVNPGSDKEGDWRILSLHEDASKVVKTLAVSLRKPFYGCIATLYKQRSTKPDSVKDAVDIGTALACTSTDDKQTYNITLSLDKIGGGARDVTMAITPLSLSDLYVAGLKGIGYYASQLLSHDPVVVLPNISFKQVVAVEKALDNNKSKISVFAVSTSSSLYYIEGARDKRGHVPVFTASGYPIRTDIGFLSTQFNPAFGVAEAVYVSRNNTQVRHILRDPNTAMWSEKMIHVRWDKEIETTYDAFETRVTFRSDLGSVGPGYSVSLTASDYTYALINDKSHAISAYPLSVTTDSTGSISVVIQSDLSVSGPTLYFTIEGAGKFQTIKVEPRQRVIKGFTKYSTGTDLKKAKSTAGGSVFTNTDIKDSTFDDIVAVLKEVSRVLANPNHDGSYGSTAAAVANMQVLRGLSERKELIGLRSNMQFFSFGDWLGDIIEDIGNAVEAVVDTIGDVVETVVNGVETVFNAVGDVVVEIVHTGIAVVNGVVNFVAKISGTVYRWALGIEGTIVRSIIACLKATLGLDTTRFFALFGFAWDHENVVKKQKIIAESVTRGIPVLRTIVSDNLTNLKQAIKDTKSNIKPYIKDERIPQQEDTINFNSLWSTLENSAPGKLLKDFLDNPIIQGIISFTTKWIKKICGLLDDVLSLPGAAAIAKLLERLTEIASKLIQDEASNAFRFANDIIAKIKEFFTGKRNFGELFTVVLSDLFWTVFDAMEDLADAFLDVLAELIYAFLDVISGLITIPAVSAFWEALNDIKFTVLNVLSMSVAQILYLFTMIWKGKLPFNLMPPWYTLLPALNSVKLASVHSSEKAHARIAGTTLFAAAEDKATTTETEKYDKKWNMVIDLGLTVVSNMSVCGATALAFPNCTPTVESEAGYELIEMQDMPFAQGAPSAEAAPVRDGNLTITKAVNWMKFVFNGISLVSEIVLFIRGIPMAKYNYIKGYGILLKSIDMIITVSTLAGLPTITFDDKTLGALFSPVANMLNAFCGVLDFVYSDKLGSDGAALAVSIAGGSSAVCDFVAVVGDSTDQFEVSGLATVTSFSINVIGCIGGSLVTVCLKDKELEGS